MRHQTAAGINQGNGASESIFLGRERSGRIRTGKDFVNAAADQIGSRRGTGKFLHRVGAIKEKKRVLEVLRPTAKTIR